MTGATEIVVADIGGTHARFALATVADDGGIALGPPTVVRTGDFLDLPAAWRAFTAGQRLPRTAAIAVAAPVGGSGAVGGPGGSPAGDEILALTNNPWTLHPAMLASELGLDRLTLVNDFAAVAHAVARLDETAFANLCGPECPLDLGGVVSIVGPGTGLGVAHVVGGPGGPRVVATEGGHSDFAPLDDVDDALLARLRQRFGRVSVERVVAGAGLAAIHAVLAERAGLPGGATDDLASGTTDGLASDTTDDHVLWTKAFAGTDPLAAAALDRFCRILGAVAGNIALTHGASGVVIAGGLGLRLAGLLPRSTFAAAFAAKGRFAAMMAGIPVKVLVHPHPGLYGAAAAFAATAR